MQEPKQIAKRSTKRPISIQYFAAITFLGPAALVGLYFLRLAIVTTNEHMGLGEALATVALFRLFQTVLFAVVIIALIFGLSYAHRKARKKWAYYIFPLIIPITFLIIMAVQFTSGVLYRAHPDYARYQQNISLCRQVSRYSPTHIGDSSIYDEDVMKKVSIDYVPINTKIVEAKTYADAIWSGADSPCSDQHMTPEELEELKNHNNKIIENNKEYDEYYNAYVLYSSMSVLEEVMQLEQVGDIDAALAYEARHLNSNWMGIKECRINTDVCSIKWVDQSTGKEMSSTQSLLELYRNTIQKHESGQSTH